MPKLAVSTQSIDLFFSYNRRDRSHATIIHNRLRSNWNINSWRDEEALPGDGGWLEKIRQQIRNTPAAALVLGPNGWGPSQKIELDLVLERRRADAGYRVICVLLPNADEALIRQLGLGFEDKQWADYRGGVDGISAEYADGVLVSGVMGWQENPVPAEVRAVQELKLRAAEWTAGERSDDSLLYRGALLKQMSKIGTQRVSWMNAEASALLVASAEAETAREKRDKRTAIIIAAVATVVLALVVILSLRFLSEKRLADSERAVAESARREADKSAETATHFAAAEKAAREDADIRAKESLGLQLAAESSVVQSDPENAELSVLLAIEGINRVHLAPTDKSMREAIDPLLRTHPNREYSIFRTVPITRVSFSPDERWIAIATEDGTVEVADARTGRRRFSKLLGGVTRDIAFSPESDLIALAGSDNTARVFDLVSGSEVALNRHAAAVVTVAFDSRSNRFSSVSQDGQLETQDARGGNAAVPLHVDAATGDRPEQALAFTPDGTTLAVVNASGRVTLVDVQKRTADHQIPPIEAVHAPARVLGFSGDSREMAIAQGGAVRLFRPDSGVNVGGKFDFREAVEYGYLTKEGGSLAIAGRHSAAIWNVGASKLYYSNKDGTPARPILAFDPLGRFAVVGTTQVSSFSEDGRGEGFQSTQDVGVRMITFSPGGTLLAVAGSEGKRAVVNVYMRSRWHDKLRYYSGNHIDDFAFTSDGRLLAVEQRGDDSVLFEVYSDRELARVKDVGSQMPVFSPDGSACAIFDGSFTAHIFETHAGRAIRTFPRRTALDDRDEHHSWLSFAFSADGGMWAEAQDDTLSVFDVRSGKKISSGDSSGGPVEMTFSPNGQYLSVIMGDIGDDSESTVILILDARNLKKQYFEGDFLGTMSFSPDSELFAAVTSKHSIRLVDIRSSRDVRPILTERDVRQVLFSSTGSTLAVIAGEMAGKNSIFQIDVKSGAKSARSEVQQGVAVWAFRRDGTMLAVLETRGSIRVYDPSGREVRRAYLVEGVHLKFSPDGTQLAALSPLTLLLHDMGRERLVERACSLLTHNMSLNDWNLYLGVDEKRPKTCPNLPW